MATTPDEVQTSGTSGRQIAIAVLGLVALLALLWFLFLRGGPEDTVAVTPPVVASPAPEVEATPEPGDKPGKGPLETFEVFAPKDPFKPLIAQAGTGTVPATTGTTDGTTAGGTAGGDGNGSAPSGGSDISGGDGGSSSNVGGRRVRLIDTFRAGGETRARVQVDGTVYTVSEGDRFADNFELMSVSGSCASMLYGDDQFSLCEGEEILK